jgi:hypothetical protein
MCSHHVVRLGLGNSPNSGSWVARTTGTHHHAALFLCTVLSCVCHWPLVSHLNLSSAEAITKFPWVFFSLILSFSMFFTITLSFLFSHSFFQICPRIHPLGELPARSKKKNNGFPYIYLCSLSPKHRSESPGRYLLTT